MLSEITRGALDPEGWQPLIDAWPDWFEVIHLYGTKSGWERLKQLSLTRIPLHDTSPLLTGSPRRSQHPCLLARPPRPAGETATASPQGACSRPQRSMPVRIRQEVQALPRGDGRVALSCCSRKIHFVTLVPAQALRPARNALHSFGRFKFLTIRD
jgi:hypothetical protein